MGRKYRVATPGPAGASADALISAAIHAATGSEIVVLSGRLNPGLPADTFRPGRCPGAGSADVFAGVGVTVASQSYLRRLRSSSRAASAAASVRRTMPSLARTLDT